MPSPFWKTSEKIQKILWKADDELLDKVWALADAQLKPHDGCWDGRDLTAEGVMLFELGRIVDEKVLGRKPADAWGFDTGANYMAIFVGTEEEVAQRMKSIGVPL